MKQPVGVVGVIVPWNYPLYLAVGPLVSALAAGNRVLIKMSELTPHFGQVFAQLVGRYFPQEEVAVTAQAEVFNPAETRIQTTIRTETLQELPLQGRNFLGLVALGPGITGHGAVGGGAPADAPDNFSTEKTVEASGNGRNYSGNQFTLDGLNVTSNILQGVANLSPNPDSVQEISVQTNTFGVENGRGSSVQVALQRRAGNGGAWGTLDAVATDAAGAIAYEDRGIEPGKQYSYRLGIHRPGGDEFLGETRVTVPAAAFGGLSATGRS